MASAEHIPSGQEGLPGSGSGVEAAGGAPPEAKAPLNTTALVTTMLAAGPKVSDLIFSPGRRPQVELNGQLVSINIPGLPMLTATHTASIAANLLGSHQHAAQVLKDEGSCDLSYSLPGKARFRVNIFRQRGSFAVVMRVISYKVPGFAELRLPEALQELSALKSGIVLVTGPAGSGKSSTLAAIVDKINAERADHIVTIENPIEFLYTHKLGTVHQRELYSDTPSFAMALRSALRQSPKVIMVSELTDRETIEVALTAAETGHLVLSALHTLDASKTVERLVGAFPLNDQQGVRNRLAASFQYLIAQRLFPRRDGQGSVAAVEIVRSTQRTRECIERGESEGRSLLDAIRQGEAEGMQHLDGELVKLVRSGTVELEAALPVAANPGNLRLALSDYDPTSVA